MAGKGSPIKDATGQRFGRLVVLRLDRLVPRQGAAWVCRCECGIETVVLGQHLRKGAVRSCGCLRREVTTTRLTRHGAATKGGKTRAYVIWEQMRSRCETPTHRDFKDYGGRGIAVCERWRAFENFLADMGEPPAGTSIERSNNAVGYQPGNCVWASRAVQANNTRANVVVTTAGESMTLAEFVRKNGLQYSSTRMQVKRGARFIAGQHIEVSYPARNA